MIRVQKKVSTGLKVLQYYTTKIWVFNNTNLRNLREKLNDHDKAVFNFDIRPVRILFIILFLYSLINL